MQAGGFLEPWEEVSAAQAAAFMRELEQEISAGHALQGVRLQALAHSRCADEVLFQLEDGRLAEVHLTWSQHAESPPWPLHRLYAHLEEWIKQVMLPAHQDR